MCVGVCVCHSQLAACSSDTYQRDDAYAHQILCSSLTLTARILVWALPRLCSQLINENSEGGEKEEEERV